MSDAITVLLLEHRQIAKVLDLIEEQHINLAQHAPANYGLLETMLDYLSDYPAECHHPKEDLVYRRLLKRVPDTAGSLKDLAEEHWKLAQQTQSLARTIGDSRKDSPSLDAHLAGQLKSFVDFYRFHMRMEEDHFFPLALQRLTREDLAEIDFTLFNQPDHFGGESEDKFAELHAAIAKMGTAERVGTYQRDEADLLAKFRDVASFNEAMRVTGEHVHLRRKENGYDLDYEGGITVHIPDCDEERAAWCAYFFWKATAMACALP